MYFERLPVPPVHHFRTGVFHVSLSRQDNARKNGPQMVVAGEFPRREERANKEKPELLQTHSEKKFAFERKHEDIWNYGFIATGDLNATRPLCVIFGSQMEPRNL